MIPDQSGFCGVCCATNDVCAVCHRCKDCGHGSPWPAGICAEVIGLRSRVAELEGAAGWMVDALAALRELLAARDDYSSQGSHVNAAERLDAAVSAARAALAKHGKE